MLLGKEGLSAKTYRQSFFHGGSIVNGQPGIPAFSGKADQSAIAAWTAFPVR
ncbi:hypothetical protein [Paenibacillus cookii]|uniref:Uncharacterized protein n=1 Tax=Paenibacillus cookii TaxID=157839 RepID=A0ABQ4M5Z2_9BACL|nr:hypothetical protein [Paenibacillus cookii]GIO70351.1 hypothetical protein J21TS3_51720 [Paenibacillus cookii]